MPEVFFAFFLLNYYFFSLNPQVFFAVNFELKQCPWFPKVLYLLFSLNHHMYLGAVGDRCIGCVDRRRYILRPAATGRRVQDNLRPKHWLYH